MNCSDGIWLGATDFQKEGTMMNITNYYYENIFKDEQRIYGENLSYTNWEKNQPNGGISENCVIAHKNGWRDKNCENQQCVACSIQANKLYKLKGLCSVTQ